MDRSSGSRLSASRANPILEDERSEGRMMPADAPLTGEALLSAITEAMVALH
jgi:hypothetical protein